MGFFKRLFKSKRKKEAEIYVPEFTSAPYAAYSYARRSQEQLGSPPREDPVIQITRERSRSISRERPAEPLQRSRSPTSSLAPSTLLDVNPDLRRSRTSSTCESGQTTLGSLTPNNLPQTRDTYRVKVHGRVRHSSTEFPFANPPIPVARSRSNTPTTEDSSLPSPVDGMPLSPEDANRVLRLRQDPSVTSLLNVWDIAGKPRAGLFANTPVAPRRTPTLRTLLGSEARPKKHLVTGSPEQEGDISWAERFLDECLGRGALSADSLNVPNDANKTFTTVDTSCASEANDPALSSMQVERGTFAEESSESISLDEPSQQVLTNSYLVRSPSKRASQVFKFLVDPAERPSTPSSINALSNVCNEFAARSRTPSGGQVLSAGRARAPTPSSLQGPSNARNEPVRRAPTPSHPHVTPSVTSLLNPRPAVPGINSEFKPLPTPPPSLHSDVRLRMMQTRNVGPRMPVEQRVRSGSLPLLSIEQFNQQFPDDDEDGDESIYVTPSRPSKRPAPRQLGKQSAPLLLTPSASTSSQEGSYNKKTSQHTRRRSQTLSRLDNPYLSSMNSGNTPRSSLSSQRPSVELAKLPVPPSNHLNVPRRDFMASLRQRTASAVGSIVSLSKSNKRYSDRFVAIEWDQYSRS